MKRKISEVGDLIMGGEEEDGQIAPESSQIAPESSQIAPESSQVAALPDVPVFELSTPKETDVWKMNQEELREHRWFAEQAPMMPAESSQIAPGSSQTPLDRDLANSRHVMYWGQGRGGVYLSEADQEWVRREEVIRRAEEERHVEAVLARGRRSSGTSGTLANKEAETLARASFCRPCRFWWQERTEEAQKFRRENLEQSWLQEDQEEWDGVQRLIERAEIDAASVVEERSSFCPSLEYWSDLEGRERPESDVEGPPSPPDSMS